MLIKTISAFFASALVAGVVSHASIGWANNLTVVSRHFGVECQQQNDLGDSPVSFDKYGVGAVSDATVLCPYMDTDEFAKNMLNATDGLQVFVDANPLSGGSATFTVSAQACITNFDSSMFSCDTPATTSSSGYEQELLPAHTGWNSSGNLTKYAFVKVSWATTSGFAQFNVRGVKTKT